MSRRDVMSEIFPSLGENSHLMAIDPFPWLKSRGAPFAVDWTWCTNHATGDEA
jgi:hypothetical protein